MTKPEFGHGTYSPPPLEPKTGIMADSPLRRRPGGDLMRTLEKEASIFRSVELDIYGMLPAFDQEGLSELDRLATFGWLPVLETHVDKLFLPRE